MSFSHFEDLERLARLNQDRSAKMEEILAEIPRLTGEGFAANERVKVIVAGGSAIKELHLDPRVMRMDSQSLAESIVAAANAASEDLRKKIETAMASVVDESPFDYLNGKVDPREKMQDIQRSLQQSMDDIMKRAEAIRRDLLKE